MGFCHRNIYSSVFRRFRPCSAAAKSAQVLFDISSTTTEESITLQLLSWGRGTSWQLDGDVEESLIYPSAVATMHLTPNFCLSEATAGCLSQFSGSYGSPVEVGISCGLFQRLGGGWTTMDLGKGDCGRLGFGHENSVFVPTLDPHLESHIRSIALGGLHSVALDSIDCLHLMWVPTNPRCAERLPPGIIVLESDYYMHRLYGNPGEDLIIKPKYLVTFTVGFDQKKNIDAAVKKTSEWSEFE